MLEPAWPAKGTTHVRGLDPPDSVDRDCPFSRTKKLKSHQVTIAPAENILTKICHDVNLREVETTVKHPDYRTHSYLTIPPEVRLPKRLVTTSSQLQDMVRPRTQARLLHPKALAHKIAADSDSESDMALGPGGKVHPALMNLYIRLGHELTAFDTNTFDTHPWEVKYAPQRGCDVLQPTKEMEVLETWLIGLRTELFDVPDPRKRKPRKTAPKGVVKKKRKKGGDDLNGFVVTSEEEMNYMDELTDPDEEEGDWTVATAKSKKSTIRSGDKDLFQDLGDDATDAKKTNAVLISGPTGCGKSAAVYAVAKQLGYTVFEVSPGSRRNGKDLLDLVGDMSRNHLVHQAKAAAESTNPFSRARAAAGRETTPQSVTSEDAGRPQQSLILLEEVDILFEEDKTFWSSVVTLMAKSKRPIIMTCNDEEVIPLDTLSLHAILRFSRPPVDLIVDYLILMAANEGHLLQTQCVRDLVHANYRDLRRCIMELQFHCRIGVGDRTGSLNWQIIRFPHGCDVADSGEVMRVVSVDTYREGMGWLDFAPSAREEERWEHVWDQFGVDVATQDAGLESCVRAITDGNGMGRKEALGLTVEFLEARSVADAVSRGAMSASHQPQIDATHPERTSATILDDQVGYPTLSTPLHPSTTDRAVTIAAHHLAWSFFSVATKQHTPYPPTPNSTTILTAVTNRHLPPTPTITDEPLFSPIHYQALFHPFSLFHPKFAFTPQLVHSCVYPGTTALVEEAAPMIRGILRHDVADERRRRKAGLMSAGGKRKTRAARMALEGKGRGGRGDRWFLGVGAEVLVTCGERWGEAVEWAMQRKVNESGDGENTESCEEMEMKS
ncbi:P-loop containing nucleoside triphosphate hydrolase protein [Ascodesmis nigricans]|uniref:P-loop containing nucleoside triphosphate hydrolase protein n=1 Tax=Ascodesmis nigricans TaxID=341454 RepID=A0A4S2MQC4_9PEZI|nr:P-loop containing nucleoside triphosphate hydrolase protein [Ascodesmis nigricans]